MSCIVGIVDGNNVYIGADSAGVAGSRLRSRADHKVFRKGDFIIGFAGSFRLGQILQYDMPNPTRQGGQDVDEFMRTGFINAVRQALMKGGVTQRDMGQEMAAGAFLVGYQGRLFCVEPDFQVGEASQPYMAVGIGDQVALGALHASQGQPAEKRIKQALEAAEQFTLGVRQPFFVLNSTNQNEAEVMAQAKGSDSSVGNQLFELNQRLRLELFRLSATTTIQAAEFDESKVKRDEGGKFATKSGGGGSKSRSGSSSASQTTDKLSVALKDGAVQALDNFKENITGLTTALGKANLRVELLTIENKNRAKINQDMEKYLDGEGLKPIKDAFNKVKNVKPEEILGLAKAAIEQAVSDPNLAGAVGVLIATQVALIPVVAVYAALEKADIKRLFLKLNQTTVRATEIYSANTQVRAAVNEAQAHVKREADAAERRLRAGSNKK